MISEQKDEKKEELPKIKVQEQPQRVQYQRQK